MLVRPSLLSFASSLYQHPLTDVESGQVEDRSIGVRVDDTSLLEVSRRVCNDHIRLRRVWLVIPYTLWSAVLSVCK